MNERIYEIIREFDIEGNVTEILPWGNGLINDTFRINTDTGVDYLMQRINGSVYTNIDGMMQNIYMVTERIRKQTFYLRNGRTKQSLYLVPLKNGALYYKDPVENCGWRIYNFMKDAYSIEVADQPFEMYKSGMILGQFHYLLRDFPVEEMIVTIPDFHNPAVHYKNLLKAAAEDRAGRVCEVAGELEFFRQNQDKYDYFNRAMEEGRLPIRVNHNDPKVNNVMFDRENAEPICMVDLDTIMPGIIPFDFGDAIRSAMCTGRDRGDATNFDAIGCDLETYELYHKGFVEGCQGILTPEELSDLPKGAILIAYESAMRYLADYLNGDTYYKIKYPGQNLVKTRMHIRLAQDLEQKLL